MKVIFLYGPPAVGKLTVAQELAKLTEYKLFHNHLTVDMVESLFPRTTPQYKMLLRKYRLEIIGEAAKADVSFILTFAYRNTEDTNAWVGALVRKVKKYGGQICFVRLQCDFEELKKRLKHPTREKFGKMKALAKLKDLMKNYDILSEVPHPNRLTIDNTNLAPKKAAQIIKKHFRL